MLGALPGSRAWQASDRAQCHYLDHVMDTGTCCCQHRHRIVMSITPRARTAS